jgi:UDP-2,3-diacylglucosamine hydrolase
MILVADSHLTDQHPKRDEFFAMLARIEQTEEDLVLLGDILDLWLGPKRFETESGKRLLDWCRRELPRRRIGLLEGNHEFYVGACHSDCFSFWSSREWREGELLLAHGDLVNRRDHGYRLLRLATKNPFSRLFFSLVPGGRSLVHAIKRKLDQAGKQRRKYLPEDAVHGYADRWFAQGVRRIFLGHFHGEHRYASNGGECLLVPSWQMSGKVMRYDRNRDHAELIPWQDI